jgi:alkylhydroperoxidase family enzyme
MAWIKTIDPKNAEGLLARIYQGATQRAGRVFQLIRLQSLRPNALRASTQLYVELMFGSHDGLTRPQREMIAVVVSRANDCHY